MVARLLWEQDAAGSNPVASAIKSSNLTVTAFFICEQSKRLLWVRLRARPEDDEASITKRSGQSFGAATRHNKTLGTARWRRSRRCRRFVLGCRLGRCFCAMHRGVHRTPAPCRLDQKIDNLRQKVVDFYLLLLHYSFFTNPLGRFLAK